MVEYTGGFNIVSGDATIVGNQVRTYITSNQDYAAHINNKKTSPAGNAVDQHYTVEFGEEHFKDLRMQRERSTRDDFGRPSNEWSYKKVTIGTFPVEPDYTYTTQVAHDIEGTTDASKVRALGLNGFETTEDGKSAPATNLTINGKDMGVVEKVADIANYTDNGTLVEVYVDDDDADFISDVVVVKTQLMEIKRVGSDYVSLDKIGPDKTAYGYNDDAINERVLDVELEDACFALLHEMKAGDNVAVIPVTTDGGSSYTVAKAYKPETVEGSLTRVDTFGTAGVGRKAISVTVGGTEYKIAQWNKDLTGIDGDAIRVTKKDVTLTLDEYGNALKADDVGSTNDWMVIKNYRQGLVNGSIVTYANGWDINGDTLSLNIGGGSAAAAAQLAYRPGDLVYYTNNTNSNTAEWKLDMSNAKGVYNVDAAATPAPYEIKASNTSIALDNYAETAENTTSDRAIIDTKIQFIYVSFDEDGEVDSIEFVTGVKDAKNEEIRGAGSAAPGVKNAQACVSLSDGKVDASKSAVKAVVIKRESTDASVGNLLYISNYHGSATKYDSDNRPVYGYEAVIMGSNGKVAEEDAVVYSYKNLQIGQFARFTKVAVPEGVTGVNEDEFYDLRGYGVDNAAGTWGRSAAVASTQFIQCLKNDKNLVRTSGKYAETDQLARTAGKPEIYDPHKELDNLGLGDTDASNLLNIRGSSWVDLRNVKDRIEDVDDLKDFLSDNPTKGVYVSILFNDNPDSNDFRHAYLIVVNGIGDKDGGVVEPEPTTGAVTFDKSLTTGDKGVGTLAEGAAVTTLKSGVTTAKFTINKPSWASALGGEHDVVEIAYDIYVDGEKWSAGDSVVSERANGLTADTAKTAFTAEVNVTGTNLTANDVRNADGTLKKVTLVITKVDWKYALVEYTMNGSPAKLLDSSNGPTLHIPTNKDKAERIYFALDVEKVNNADASYSISGILTDGLETSQYENVAWSSGGSTQKEQHTDKVMVAKGGETVKVIIDMKTDAASQYTIKGAGDLDSTEGGIDIAGHFGVPSASVSDTKETVKLQIVTLDEIKEGQDAAVEIKLSSTSADTGVYKYIATLKVNGQTITEDLSNSGGRKFVIENVTSDIEITEDMITIERVEVPHVVSAEVKGGTSLVLTFNIPVAFADGASLGGTDSSKVQHTLSKDGMTLTFTVTEADLTWGAGPDDDDTIGIGVAKVHAVDDENNTNKTIVVTVKAGTAKTEIDNRWS